MQDLSDNVAAVTGAGSGIGKALAERFAAEGMRLALADRDPVTLAETVGALRDAGNDVAELVTDVRLAPEVAAFADMAFATFGAVDVLCNNAGVFSGGLLWERQPEDFAYALDVNLWGILHGVRSFVPRMIAQAREAHVVNTCSTAGLSGSPLTGPYTISKFAAFAATECLAFDLESVGSSVRAHALCPGPVDTAIASSNSLRPEAYTTVETADSSLIEEVLAGMTAGSIAPGTVADLVVEAIRTDRFCIVTGAATGDALRTRGEELAAGRRPPLAPFA